MTDFDFNDDEHSDNMDFLYDEFFPVELRYCISCDRIVAITSGWLGDVHTIVAEDENLDVCHGPFTLSTPPEDNPDWELNVEEPSPEELADMNLEAEILLQELEG